MRVQTNSRSVGIGVVCSWEVHVITMKIRLAWLALAIVALATLQAQQREGREFYRPVTNGDGLRYPFALSPAIWNVLGPIIPVRGTDQRLHFAYTVELTNHSSQPMTIQSFQSIRPRE
jgi:hypothetical protein